MQTPTGDASDDDESTMTGSRIMELPLLFQLYRSIVLSGRTGRDMLQLRSEFGIGTKASSVCVCVCVCVCV